MTRASEDDGPRLSPTAGHMFESNQEKKGTCSDLVSEEEESWTVCAIYLLMKKAARNSGTIVVE